MFKETAVAQERTKEMLQRAGIVITDTEAANIEIADFGLGELEKTGLQIITYMNNDRYCAKELVMFPRQICPEHRHPEVEGVSGKRETFRVRSGKVFLNIPGEKTENAKSKPHGEIAGRFTVFHEIELLPGMQYTLEPDTLHWFQAGDEGAVVSEFSSTSRDKSDIFTDEKIVR